MHLRLKTAPILQVSYAKSISCAGPTRIKPVPLPAAKGESAKIISGEWFLRANLHFFRGEVLNGTIFNNGDNTFT